VARSYDISLLPSLVEQAAFFKKQSQELVQFCQDEYGKFLSMLDEQSNRTDDAGALEDLEIIYTFAADRLEALQEMMSQEISGIEDWERSLERVSATGDTALWADVAQEMLEDGDFKKDTNEFKAWVASEMANLRSGVTEVLSDWRAAIEEGSIKDLARFVEALDDMEAEEAEFEDSDECCDDDEECSAEGCDDEQEGCCGKQDPCCRTEGAEDEDDEDAF